jgi:hypothetical protein
MEIKEKKQMKRKTISAIIAGLAALGTTGSAVAVTIDSVQRHVSVSGPGEFHESSSAAAGLFSDTLFVDHPSGLPPVSAASQLSTVELLDQGSSLVVNARGDQGGWAGASTSIFRRGGAGQSFLSLSFTVDTSADWTFNGGTSNSSYASIGLMDTTTNDSIFLTKSDDPSPGYGIFQGTLAAGHQYRFTMFAVGSYDLGGDVGGGYASGRFAVSEVAPIPEPETYAMMLAGLGLLGLMSRRRQRQTV